MVSVSEGFVVRRDTPKRLFDVVVSVVALVLLSPLLCVLALTVWLDSGRPVLFRPHQAAAGVPTADRSETPVDRTASRGIDTEAPVTEVH